MSKSHLKTLLNDLGYDYETFSMQGFVKHIETLKKRKLHFTEWDLPPELFGLWISNANKPVEYIFFAKDLPPILRTHVQLHEISHFLCQHPTLKIGDNRSLENLLPMFRSNLYTNEMEVEAETLAAMIQARVFRYSLEHELSVSISSRPATADFLKAMGLV